MSTQISKSTTTDSTRSRIDQYVGKQLKRTSQQVRFSDLVTGVLALIAYTLTFFILAAIVDAWIWPFSLAARWFTLLLFITGLGTIGWIYLVPYLARKINPEYAARMIEESKPGFKNSLLNYLALKRDQRPAHRAILNEVSKRAATDLSGVSIDSAVDKSNLIRIGFVLVALVALSIAYLIFSPKSPLPTVMRVLSPGAKIARPAAVMIQDVTPGDTSVFFGDRQEVTARVIGNHEPGDVQLVFSSQDSQIVDAVIPMQYSGANGVYSAILETGPAGIQQPLNYFVAALDGVSPTYAIDVRANPSITINAIKIIPPKYTGLPERTIEGYGEIQAVEGSDVEISVTANLPIEVAYLVPLVAKDDSADNTQFRELRSIAMNSEGNQATGHFVASLNSNRDRPLFTHYKIKFRSKDDYQNDQANIYPIRVIADLAPEVEIVEPVQNELAIPANQPFMVEVWASDLDYEISSVDLHIDHQGTKLLDKNLHLNVDHQNAGERVKARVPITPTELNLKPGDKAIMFASAADNRISPSSKLLDPNISRTGNYTLIITDPIDNPQQPEQKPGDEGDQENSRQDDPQEQNPEQKQEQKQDGDSANDSEDQGEQNSNKQSDSEQSDSEQSDSEQSDSEGRQEPDSNSDERDDSERSNSGGSSESEQQQSDPSSSNDSESGNNNQESDSEQSSDSENSSSNSPGSDPSGDQDSSNSSQSESAKSQENGAGSEGDQQPSNRDQPSDGTSKSANGQQRGGTGEPGSATEQNGDNQQGTAGGDEFRDNQLQDGDTEPLSENASQSEQFERLKKYFDEKQKQDNESNDGSSANVADQDPSRQQSDQSTQNTSPAAEQDLSNNQQSQSKPEPGGDPDSEKRQGSAEFPSGNPDQHGAQDEQSKDEIPEQPVPNGAESQNGRPDENQQGSGSKTGDQQDQSESGNSQSESVENTQPKQDSTSDPASSDSSPSDSDSTQGSQGSDSQDGSADSDQQSQPSDGDGSKNSSDASSQSGNSESASSSQQPQSQSESQPSDSEDGSESAQPSDSSSESNSGSQQNNTAKQGGNPGAGGKMDPNQNQTENDAPNPEQANLEYTKKVTDLILNNLEDQQYEPDQELLDQMNWTRADLEKFLKQWQQMKDNAMRGDVKAKRVYEEALRSLGLDRNPKGRTVNVKRDAPFQLNEDGAVEQIPAEYVDKFNSFLKRRNRSKRK